MLKVVDLKKDYPNVHALRGLSLTIAKGEFVSIMGKSGCGKSTLLYCMSGILQPTAGDVVFKDQSLFVLKADQRAKIRRASMGFVFQLFNLIPELTVKENILLPVNINKIKLDEAYYEKLIADLELTEFMDRFPNTLSGGQQQRVAMARALVHKPELVFADEPTGNLDEASGKEVIELLLSLQKSLKLTLVLVTHDRDIAAYADRIIRMRDGKLDLK